MAKQLLTRYLTFFLIYAMMTNVYGLFKLTKVECISHNKTLLIVSECRIHAINREISKGYFNGTCMRSVDDLQLHIYTAKKANGYRPFLYNFTVDFCEYMRKRNNPVVNMMWDTVTPFSNMNHTCPYTGDLIVNGAYLNIANLKNLPLPDGQYAIYLTTFFYKYKALQVTVFFDYQL